MNLAEVIPLVLDYFTAKKVVAVAAFLCWEKGAYLQLSKGLSHNGIAVSISEVSDSNVECLQRNNNHIGVVVDFKCKGSGDLMDLISSQFLFDPAHEWLILDYAENDTCIKDISENTSHLRILSDSDLVWSCNCRELYEVFKMSLDLNPTALLIANASKIDRKQILEIWFSRREPLGKRRRNLGGITLKAVQVISDPAEFTTYDDLKVRHIDTFTKANYHLVSILADDVNFRLEVIMQADSFGWETNGTFDGLMGFLQRREIDLGSCAVLMRLDRFRVVDYTTNMLPISPVIMFRQPSLSTVSNIFKLPFDTEVWLCCCFLYIIIAIIISIQAKFSRRFDTIMTNMVSEEIFSLVFGIICQQGYYRSPTSVSSRISVLFAFMASIAIFTSYSANIVALLQSPSRAIKTITDLALSHLSVGIQDEVYNRVYFHESTDSATRLLYEQKMAPRGSSVFMLAKEGIIKMRTGLFAFQVEKTAGYQIISDTYTENEKCGLAEIEAFSLPRASLPLVKRSPYKELFKIRMLWHKETGLQDRIRKVWYPQKPICNEGQRSFNIMKHIPFIARTVFVQNNNVDDAARLLNRILGREGILDQWRRTRYYEKPFQVRRRINYEKCKAIYDEDMDRKIQFVLRKNRIPPFAGYDL